MGLEVRLDGLVGAAKTTERRTAIRDAAKRLVDRTGMGKEYQVMGITSAGGEAGKVWPFYKKDIPSPKR